MYTSTAGAGATAGPTSASAGGATGAAAASTQSVRKMDYIKFIKLGDDAGFSRPQKYFWVVDSARRHIGYYKNDQALKPKRVIDPMDVLSTRATQSGQGRVYFLLIERRAAKTIQLRFKTRAERDSWLAAVRTVLQLAASDHRVHDAVNLVRRHLARASHDLGFEVACNVDELAHNELLYSLFIEAIEAGADLVRRTVATLGGRGMSLAGLIARVVIHVNLIVEPLLAADPSLHVPFAGTCYDPAAKQLEIGVDLMFPTDPGDFAADSSLDLSAGAAADDEAGSSPTSARHTKHKVRTINVDQALSMLSSRLWRNPQFDQLLSLDDESSQASAEISRLLLAHRGGGRGGGGGGDREPFSQHSRATSNNEQCFRFNLQWSHTLHEQSDAGAVEEYVKDFVSAGLLGAISDMIRSILDEDAVQLRRQEQQEAEEREEEDEEDDDGDNASGNDQDGPGKGGAGPSAASLLAVARDGTTMPREPTSEFDPDRAAAAAAAVSSAASSARRSRSRHGAAPTSSSPSASECLHRYVRGVGIQIDGASVEQRTPPQLSLILVNWDDPQITAAVAMSSRLRRLHYVLNNTPGVGRRGAGSTTSGTAMGAPLGSPSAMAANLLAGSASLTLLDRTNSASLTQLTAAGGGGGGGGSAAAASTTTMGAVAQLKERMLEIIAYARVAHACRAAETELSSKMQLHDPISIAWEGLADAIMMQSFITYNMSPTTPSMMGGGGSSGAVRRASSTSFQAALAAGGGGRRSPDNTANGMFFSASSDGGGGMPPPLASSSSSLLSVAAAGGCVASERDLVRLVDACRQVLVERYGAFVEHTDASGLGANLRRIVRRVTVRFQRASQGDVSLLSPVVDRGVITDAVCILVAEAGPDAVGRHRQQHDASSFSSPSARRLRHPRVLPDTPSFLDAPLYPLLWHASVFAGFAVGNLLSWFRGFVSVPSNLVPFPEFTASGGRGGAGGGGDASMLSHEEESADSDEDEAADDVGELVAFERTLETRILKFDDAVNAVYDNQGADAQCKVAANVIEDAMHRLNAAFPQQHVTNHDLSRVVGMTLLKARVLFQQNRNALQQLQQQQLTRGGDAAAAAAADMDRDVIAVLKQYCEFDETRNMVDRLVAQKRRERPRQSPPQPSPPPHMIIDDGDEEETSLNRNRNPNRQQQEPRRPQQQQQLQQADQQQQQDSVTPSSSDDDDAIVIIPEAGPDGAVCVFTADDLLPSTSSNATSPAAHTPGISAQRQQPQLQQQQQHANDGSTSAERDDAADLRASVSARIVTTTRDGRVLRTEDSAAFAARNEQQRQRNELQRHLLDQQHDDNNGQNLRFDEFASVIVQHLMPLEAALSVRARRNVLVVGVEDAGKSLVIESMRDDFSGGRRSMPPTEPTIGLTTTLVPFGNWVIGCRELGGREQQRSYVKEFEPMLTDLQGVVFVVDATRRDNIADTKEYLHLVLGGLRKLRDLPCLLLLNNSLAQRAMPTQAMLERLDWAGACAAGNHTLHQERRCSIVSSGVHRRGTFSGDGARDGFVWLCQEMSKATRGDE